MQNPHWFGIAVLSVAICCHSALAQAPAEAQGSPTQSYPADSDVQASGVDLDWTPQALAQLGAQASTKSSFVLDRSMLAAAAGLIPDTEPETRHAIAKIDGISVRMLRFPEGSMADEALVEALRESYHRRGWKHLITTNSGGAVHDKTTDVWLTMEGINVRGAVLLVETPHSLTLATLKGDLSPVDLLHLRGHFGIPRFDGDGFKNVKDK
jgi:hypothetical protein